MIRVRRWSGLLLKWDRFRVRGRLRVMVRLGSISVRDNVRG